MKQVATVDPNGVPAPSTGQGRCLHCGMHIVLSHAGEWQHTLSGVIPCQPAWRPRLRRALSLLKGGRL